MMPAPMRQQYSTIRSEALACCRASHVSIKWSVIFNRWPLVLISASFYCLMRRAMYSDWGELKRLISQMGRGRQTFGLTGLGGCIFFFLNPLLKTAFQNAPLAADLECWNLPVLNHAMQCSLGNFQDAGGFRKGQEFDRRIGFFHS